MHSSANHSPLWSALTSSTRAPCLCNTPPLASNHLDAIFSANLLLKSPFNRSAKETTPCTELMSLVI